MTDPLNGLRFDIYERVHLPDNVAAIGELEEIELVPRMQALTEKEHVLMKGHLLLSGVYRAQDAEIGVSRLEHWIPVEITLPHSRVDRVEDLAVEIDNFDVDLLSTRSLNVTGVLSLRGMQAESPQIPVWRDDSFTVVHQAPDEEEPEPLGESPVYRDIKQDDSLSGREEERERERVSEIWPEWVPPVRSQPEDEEYRQRDDAATPFSFPIGESAPAVPADGFDRQEPAARVSYPSPVQHPAIAEPEPDAEEPEDAGTGFAGSWPSEVGWGDLSGRISEAESESQPAEPAAEEKPELKIALGGKPLDAPAREPGGMGLLSQLGEKAAVREPGLQTYRSNPPDPVEFDAKASRTGASTGDELEWTKLFLGKGAEAQPFRKVRMCIVQREETLDSIAARYNLQPRELQLRNRLSDPYLSEGQVLYIP